MAETSLTTQVKNDDTLKSEAEVQSTSSPPLSPPQPPSPLSTTTTTAEDQPTSSFAGSWFSNIVNVAKQKSSKTLEFMKRDLTEFKDTVQLNTSAAITTTTSYIGETISSLNSPKEEDETKELEEVDEPEPENETSESKELIPSPTHKSTTSNQKDADIINFLSSKAKSIFSSIVDVMIPHEYEDDDDICFVKDNKIVSIERGRWDLLIKTIQSDPQTYCHEPAGPPEDYENWLASFNLIDSEYKIDQLLSMENGMVKGFYDKLVPHSITPDEFWHRYFYKVHQLKQIEFQRLASKAEEQERQEKAEEEKAEKERLEKEMDETNKLSTPSAITLKETIKPPGSVPSRNSSSSNLEVKKSTNDFETKTMSTSINTSIVAGSTNITSSIDNLSESNQPVGGTGETSKLTSGGVSPASDSTKQSDGSEEWVKTEMMDDIVTEAMKKLDTKLTDNPGSKVKDDEDDDILYDWDSS